MRIIVVDGIPKMKIDDDAFVMIVDSFGKESLPDNMMPTCELEKSDVYRIVVDLLKTDGAIMALRFLRYMTGWSHADARTFIELMPEYESVK